MKTSLLLIAALLLAAPAQGADDLPSPHASAVDFVRDVRPILQKNCFACHGPETQKSSFRLDIRAAAKKGGDFGVAIEPKKSAESPLIRYVAGLEEGMEMPPLDAGKRLTKEQIGILRRWIDDGADWPDAVAGDELAKHDWWSLQPIVRAKVPELSAEDAKWARTPIDAFIIAKLRAEGLAPSPEADRRTLIRRLMFDLHGLPPTPEEVQAFINDKSPQAYENLVQRLLESPRYGERWARHWLDVAHYADSHGQDQDRPRPNAWPYRDYLIKSLNADKPYARFVAEQIAGDVLYPGDTEAVAATGFLAAGPWDESSLRDIREDSIDRLIGQYLDRDDIVTTVMATFTSLTANCARCHDHKFDPITQDDYYALQAVFAGIDKAERQYDPDPALAAQRKKLTDELAQLKAWQGKAAPELLTRERQAEVASFEAARSGPKKGWTVLVPQEAKSLQGAELKVLDDRSVLSQGMRPEKDTYVITAETDLASITGLRLEVLTDASLPHQGPGRQDNGNLHLSEVRVRMKTRSASEGSSTSGSEGTSAIPTRSVSEGSATPVKLIAAAADFDQEGWAIPRAIDGNAATAWGIYPAVGKAHEAAFQFEKPIEHEKGTTLVVELDQLHGGGHLMGRVRLSVTGQAEPLKSDLTPIPAAVNELLAVAAESRTDLQKAELARWLVERRVTNELAALPPPARVYCGTNQFAADGTFRPAPTPRPIHVLTRGDVNKPARPALAGAITAVPGLNARFNLPEGHAEGERRAALAKWIIDKDNPLTWRSIVNRVWHHHFGRGIVNTPNDLGRMGGTPTHPELLDWLAVEFRDNGGSLKELHRLIVTSSVYRQSSAHHAAAALKDGGNRWLWRMHRSRLDAESLRDAVLRVSGRLDDTMYGPPVMHFIMSPGVHVTPNADYDTFDIDKPEARRRSIYRFILRTRPDPLLDVLDCPDASQAAPARSESLSALQALTLWNNKFTLRHAEHLAALAAQQPDAPARVKFVAQRVLCRAPNEVELTAWSAYAEKHGLANLCRVLLNSSEFLFVD